MTDKNALLRELEEIKAQAEEALRSTGTEDDLQAWHTAHLGRSAALTNIFTRLTEVPGDQRPAVGQFANQVKQALEQQYQSRAQSLKQEALQRSLTAEGLDITLPGRRPPIGRLHPQTQTLREIYRIFAEMGFQIYLSPDVETDEFNFELLNIPPHHPARDMWNTYHTTVPNMLLRTHTSPGQIHAMREFAPEPIRVVLPGMVYRYEQMDASHEMQFYQVELLAVGRHITFGDLKGTLQDFARRMFGEGVRTRFRPSYFPFTEPSGEMDVECFLCNGQGCGVCSRTGWLEILGCGMVHPVVLQNGGYDPHQYSGFAAGMGPERISMLRYRIEDIRTFWANDLRFLSQF
jgi:phenylalanyl-tRNA synthetase alpha chain